MRTRYYSPAQGRFLSRDPIGFDGGINLYAYCYDDPINYDDKKGKVPSYHLPDFTVGTGYGISMVNEPWASSMSICGVVDNKGNFGINIDNQTGIGYGQGINFGWVPFLSTGTVRNSIVLRPYASGFISTDEGLSFGVSLAFSKNGGLSVACFKGGVGVGGGVSVGVDTSYTWQIGNIFKISKWVRKHLKLK